ncbi:L-serine ammonia-lyase, iron-sulfur-dependent, subunit beta [Erysipelothrix inopinata]|uniref:L-serine deaminase n=1 Tax=Erysipelothrix inopinata TaxID=225084 RepID=A0A7G9RXC4_9FIRM|nr:L-serine ammonia-lyase, iron-sulfur-dependent subunit beta [Erysipelothrix inopinata]QNN60249.1 L-serine ammonia-lyase, iron-sulfur-dependent, subunit beta [Erysipelothrix inopinata]
MAKDYKSVFDIIGPVMVGPSSSHTAGACRIGKMARAIFGDQPEVVNVYLFESFAKTYQGHGTNVALAGGLLGMSPDDERLHESLLIALEAGITIRFIPLEEKVDHPNTARIVMSKGNRKMTVTGVSIGGGSAKITKIDDISVDIAGGNPTILIFHQDKPGMIAKVATILSELHINIGSMKVDREEVGKDAYMVIELDQDHLATSLDDLRAIESVRNVMFIQN